MSHSKKQYNKWCEDGVERWYTGQILSVVDGTNEWLNVQYDGEEDILTLNLRILKMVTWTS